MLFVFAIFFPIRSSFAGGSVPIMFVSVKRMQSTLILVSNGKKWTHVVVAACFRFGTNFPHSEMNGDVDLRWNTENTERNEQKIKLFTIFRWFVFQAFSFLLNARIQQQKEKKHANKQSETKKANRQQKFFVKKSLPAKPICKYIFHIFNEHRKNMFNILEEVFTIHSAWATFKIEKSSQLLTAYTRTYSHMLHEK